MYPIILAGGLGSRLWPVSRQNNPKHMQPFIGEQTLLQVTWQRLHKGFTSDKIMLATNINQLAVVKKQLPKLVSKNIFIEPAKRDTAAAIGLATLRVYQKDPQAIITTVNSDAHISEINKYISYLKLAAQVVKKYNDKIVMLAINPTYPETGYGYIRMGDEFTVYKNNKIFYIDKFVEKPNLNKAKQYLRQWDYLWNPAMFVFSAEQMLDLFAKYLPKHYRLLQKIKPYIGKKNELAKIAPIYKQMPAISIDYGIMEKAKQMLVIPADFDWQDVGHWRAVKDIINKKQTQPNILKGKKIITIDSKDNLIYSYTDKIVAAIGLKDMIVIDMPDALLICPSDRSQDIKKIIDEIKLKKLTDHL